MTHATRTLIAILALVLLPSTSASGLATPVLTPPPVSVVDPAQSAPIHLVATDPGGTDLGNRPAPVFQDGGVKVFGGSDALQHGIDWAIGRFEATGLELPYLEVHFSDTSDLCDGYEAAFRHNETPLRIDVCNPNRFVIIHELAHAWEKANLDDETRAAYLKLRGLEVWNSAEVEWDQRGVEDIAELMVWGLQESTADSGAELHRKLDTLHFATGIVPTWEEGVERATAYVEPTLEDYS